MGSRALLQRLVATRGSIALHAVRRTCICGDSAHRVSDQGPRLTRCAVAAQTRCAVAAHPCSKDKPRAPRGPHRGVSLEFGGTRYVEPVLVAVHLVMCDVSWNSAVYITFWSSHITRNRSEQTMAGYDSSNLFRCDEASGRGWGGGGVARITMWCDGAVRVLVGDAPAHRTVQINIRVGRVPTACRRRAVLGQARSCRWCLRRCRSAAPRVCVCARIHPLHARTLVGGSTVAIELSAPGLRRRPPRGRRLMRGAAKSSRAPFRATRSSKTIRASPYST